MITPVQSLYLASLEKNEQKVEKHEESTKPVSSRTAPSGAIFMVDYTRKHTVWTNIALEIRVFSSNW